MRAVGVAVPSWLLGLALALALASCVQRMQGELSPAECENGLDDDGDGASDCADPDCWGYCPRRQASELRDAAAGREPSAGSDSRDPALGSDASHGSAPGPDEDAGASDDGADAGSPETAICACPADERCLDAGCVAAEPPVEPSLAGEYELQVQAALVPASDRQGLCFDVTCGGIPLECTCGLPDPYVVVRLDGVTIAQLSTLPVTDDTSPTWPNAPVHRVQLSEASRLELVVLDSDQLGFDQDSIIFRCFPSLSALPTRTLSCNPQPGATRPPPAGTTYYITIDARAGTTAGR